MLNKSGTMQNVAEICGGWPCYFSQAEEEKGTKGTRGILPENQAVKARKKDD